MFRAITMTCLFFGLLLSTTAAQDAQVQNAASTDQDETGEFPLFQKLVGEWDCEGELNMGPGVPPEHCTGTAVVRGVGEQWVMMELTNKMQGIEMSGVMTFGFDANKKQHLGTWIDSVNAHLYLYEGVLDDSGKVLSLLTEGPSPADPTKTAKMRDQIELVDDDHLLMKSAMQMEDGSWFEFSTATLTRKK